MRALLFLLPLGLTGAEPLQWSDLPPAIQTLLAQNGLSGSEFPEFRRRRQAAIAQRLAAGAAEHAAYFLLQSRALSRLPPVDPAAEARRFSEALSPSGRAAFLNGDLVAHPLSPAVRVRLDAFWNSPPVNERHQMLRRMVAGTGWAPERVVQTAFRFLVQLQLDPDPDAIYQGRGLSADPYPPSMRAVARGLEWMRENRPAARREVLLAGPGAAFGSRFGIDDEAPLVSPQPKALRALVRPAQLNLFCIDIRPEVTSLFSAADCHAETADIAATRLPDAAFDLAIATNLFVYLDDTELALALANVARALRPGGCLLHNDSRFAARLFGEAAGLPALHYESLVLTAAGPGEQLDRIVVHCRGKSPA